VLFFKYLRWSLIPIVFITYAAYASYTGTGPLSILFSPASPQLVSQNLLAGQAFAIIATGGCNHGCELQDATGGGFYINYTGQTATGNSQFVAAFSVWHPPQGSTTYAVSVYPVSAGYIVGSNTP